MAAGCRLRAALTSGHGRGAGNHRRGGTALASGRHRPPGSHRHLCSHPWDWGYACSTATHLHVTAPPRICSWQLAACYDITSLHCPSAVKYVDSATSQLGAKPKHPSCQSWQSKIFKNLCWWRVFAISNRSLKLPPKTDAGGNTSATASFCPTLERPVCSPTSSPVAAWWRRVSAAAAATVIVVISPTATSAAPRGW